MILLKVKLNWAGHECRNKSAEISKWEHWKMAMPDEYKEGYIDGSHSVGRISCGLITPSK